MRRELLERLRGVRRRLQWIEICRCLLLAGAWAAMYLTLFLLAERLTRLPLGMDAAWPFVAGSAAGLFAAGLWGRRVRLMEAALRADAELGLKERLSTALSLAEPRDESEQAVLEDAVFHARKIQPSRAFQAGLQREARWAGAPIALLAIIWFLMPQLDLFAGKNADKAAANAVTIAAKRQTAETLKDLEKQLSDTSDVRKPESVQRIDKELDLMVKQIADMKIDNEQALSKLTDMKDKLAERKAEIEKRLESASALNQRGEGKLTSDLQKAVRQGDFDKAAKLLDDLKQKLQNDKLSDQEKSSLQKELAQMGEQLGKDSPLGKAMQAASLKMQDGQFKQSLADLADAAGDLKDLQGMLAEMKQLDKLDYDMEARKQALSGKWGICENCGAEGLCFGGLCQSCMEAAGKWSASDSRVQGLGMGKGGIGQGAIAAKEEGAVGFKPTRIAGQIKPGQILARIKVPGSQVAGEVQTQYEALRLDYAQQAEDSIRKESLPLEYKSLVRDYFTSIKMNDPETPAAAPAHD